MAAIRPNPTLSDDLIREILVCVPVKSLLCFQSVSKTWLSLIKDPAFIKSQLLHAIETYNQTIIGSCFVHTDVKKFVQLYADSHQIVADFKLPYSRGEFKFVSAIILVGSANGIVCVAVSCGNCKSSIYLWNPAIRQSKVIPSYSLCHGIGEKVLGFGYDGVDHDFKVVRVVSPSSIHAEVYSDNRNAWRNVPEPMDIPSEEAFDVCINGFLCGIGKYGMMTFDLNQEVLNCAIKLPNVLNLDDDDAYIHDEARITEFNNSVAVIILMHDELNAYWISDDLKINMWALDDDACLLGGGVKASWTRIFSIDLGISAGLIYGYFSNGNLLLKMLYDDNMWILCNTYKKKARIVLFSVDLYDRQIYKYTESLLSLTGFRQVNWNTDEDDNQYIQREMGILEDGIRRSWGPGTPSENN